MRERQALYDHLQTTPLPKRTEAHQARINDLEAAIVAALANLEPFAENVSFVMAVAGSNGDPLGDAIDVLRAVMGVPPLPE